jgi:hypothetical protein
MKRENPMSRHFMSSLTALAALCLLAAVTLRAHAAGQQEGMVVARDPQTGTLRAPTPEEARALRARTPRDATLGAAVRAPERLSRPDGARGVRLGEKAMVYEVVTRAADGTLDSECVKGEQAAHEALQRPATSSHQEHGHETR